MIQTKDLEKIVALTLYSSYVANEKPVSLMIVSDRPEAGKTETVRKYYGNNGIRFLSDVTAYALWRDFHNEIESGALKHLVIPEFLAPLSRKSETVNSLISTLQMLIEEGMMEVHTGFLKPIRLKAPTTVGVVVCMPRLAFASRRMEWQLSGFLSRFMLVSYSYDDETVAHIFDSIEERRYMAEAQISLNFPEKPMPVVIPPQITHKARLVVEEQTRELRKSGKTYGYRELKNVLRMLCANVVMGNMQDGKTRDTVESSDLDEIIRLSYLMNDSFSAVRE